jgi:perosamine synthetase
MIRAIADRYGLAVVEDAAHAAGGTFRGRSAGSFGHGAFSLDAGSNVTTGEGGFVTTDDDRLAMWVRLYRNQGRRPDGQHEILGYNFRLSDVAAAIGLAQLSRLERNTARRQAIAAGYDEAFVGLPLRTPVTPVGRTHVFNRYVIDVDDARELVLTALLDAGIEVQIPYRLPLHRQPYIQERGVYADLPVTDRVAASTVALPVYPGLAQDAQERIVAAVGEALRGRATSPSGPISVARTSSRP